MASSSSSAPPSSSSPRPSRPSRSSDPRADEEEHGDDASGSGDDSGSDDEDTGETPTAQGRKRAAPPKMDPQQAKTMRGLNAKTKSVGMDIHKAEMDLWNAVEAWGNLTPAGKAAKDRILEYKREYDYYRAPTPVSHIATEWIAVRTALQRHRTILDALNAFGLEKLEMVDDSYSLQTKCKVYDRAGLESVIKQLAEAEAAIVERVAKLKVLLATRDAWLAAHPNPPKLMHNELESVLRAGVDGDVSPEYAAVQEILAKIAKLKAQAENYKAEADAQRKAFRQQNKAAAVTTAGGKGAAVRIASAKR